MNYVFEVADKTGRKIRLTKRQWEHITTKHPYMTNHLSDIEQNIRDTEKIIPHDLGNCQTNLNNLS